MEEELEGLKDKEGELGREREGGKRERERKRGKRDRYTGGREIFFILWHILYIPKIA